MNVGPRPAGFGEAFTAAADDANALAYNPAGLAQLKRQELALVHHEFFEGVRQEWGAYAIPGSWGTLAVSFNMLMVEKFKTFDANDQPLGAQGADDAAYQAAYARHLTRWLAVGGGAKYVSSRLGDDRAKATAFDGGLLLRPSERWSAGAALLNAGGKLRYVSESFELPMTARVGLAYRALVRVRETGDELTFMADAIAPSDDGVYAAGGAELVRDNLISLRAGGIMGKDSGPGYTLGVGLHFNRGHRERPEFSFDYAFIDNGELRFAHRAGFSLRFGPRRSALLTDSAFRSELRPAPAPPPRDEAAGEPRRARPTKREFRPEPAQAEPREDGAIDRRGLLWVR